MIDRKFASMAAAYEMNPISLDLIEPGLYLGNISAATNIRTLVTHHITHILTIDSTPPPRNVENNLNITSKYIPMIDSPTEDLLSHFDDTYRFIEQGMRVGIVLVHCFFGISRSASVVIAYLMKKYHITYVEALSLVKKKRPMVAPNSGFVSQLELYYEMKCEVDPNYMKFRIYRLRMAGEKVRKMSIFPLEYMDLVKPDPGAAMEPIQQNGYRCKMCHRFLVGESNLLTHADHGNTGLCTKTIFVEPIVWMENITRLGEGVLHCPKCYYKVGLFSWNLEYQCHCGYIISPMIKISPADVYWWKFRKSTHNS